MTTPDLEQIIADHRIEMAPGGYWNCHCGINVDEKGSHAAHVAAAIRDSGLAVIALPEADDADDDGSEWWVRKDSIVAEDGGVSLFAGSTEPMGADNAAELGAAILAAAQVAERNNP